MKALSNVAIIVVAAGLGLAIGFGLKSQRARESSAQSGAYAAPEVVDRTRSLGPTHKNRSVIVDDSPLATKLEKDLSMSAGVTRWLHWLEALERATPSDFPRLAQLAKGNSTAIKFIAARWCDLNPRHLFDCLVAEEKNRRGLPSQELANVLFSEWPKRDLEAAAAALSEPGTIGARSGWRMQVATTAMDNNVERGLQLMFDWHIENYGPRMGALSKWAAANPLHAAQFVIDHSSGYVSRLAMETIGKAWAQTDPVGALRFAETHQGSLGLELANATLKLWVERDLGEAKAWLAQADATTRNRLSPSFVESWAKQDPGGALSWCEEMLTGSSMAQGVGSALKGAAAKDVSAAAALVTAMEPSTARMEAAAAVSRKWFPELSSSSPKDLKPEAVSWLSNLDPQSIERVLREVVWGWSTCDPRGLAEFLSEAQVKQVPEHAYSVTARQLARTDPLAALDWAHRLPDNQGLEAGGEAFAEWRSAQPEAAMKWYNELASNDPRRQPFFEGAIRSLAFHPQAVEQLAVMPRAEKVQARSVIAGLQYLPEEKRSRLLEALNVQ